MAVNLGRRGPEGEFGLTTRTSHKEALRSPASSKASRPAYLPSNPRTSERERTAHSYMRKASAVEVRSSEVLGLFNLLQFLLRTIVEYPNYITDILFL